MNEQLTPELLASIVADPIIALYIKMSNSTESQSDSRLPTFSDTCLRLAVHEAFGYRKPQHLRLDKSTLQIYRRLLLYHYSEKYNSITTLQSIMCCFKLSDIEEAFNCVNETVTSWFSYVQSHLTHLLFKEAFLEIMLEWAKRYYYLNGELKTELCSKNAGDILEFLFWDVKYLRHWLLTFNTWLAKLNLTQTNENYASLTPEDLCNKKITRDIQNRLSPLVHKFVLKSLQLNDNDDENKSLKYAKHGSEATESPSLAKKQKIEVQKVEILKPLTSGILLGASVISKEAHKTHKDCESQKLEQEKTNCKRQTAAPIKAVSLKRRPIETAVPIVSQPQPPEEVKLPNVMLISDSEEEANDVSEVIDLDAATPTDSDKQICDVIQLDKADEDSEDEPPLRGTISRDKAICYIARLQGYALHHGYVDAIELLDQVDTVVRNGKGFK